MKILFILFMFLLFVTSCSKNEEIVPNKLEKKQQQHEGIISKNSDRQSKSKKDDFTLKRNEKDVKEMRFYELSNSLYSNGGGEKLKEKIKILSASGETIENKLKATFLESFIGDYDKALKQRKELCKNNSNLDYCKKVDLNLISYRPIDNEGKILDDVDIYVDGKKFGKLKGKQDIQLENKFIHRIKISKKGYLDYYKKIFIDKNGFQKESINPKLVKADLSTTIIGAKENKLETKNFVFNINKDTFINKDGKVIKGPIDVYLFDIGQEDGDINVLNLDAFDEKGNYLGNSMVTFGMPLVKAYDKKGNELKIGKEIVGQGKIQNKEKSPDIDLKGVPKGEWLKKENLDKYNIPPFWYLQQDAGIWISGEMKILDSDGNYEFKLK